LAPSAEVREELVEEVVRRVLDRLSDAVVREAVAAVAFDGRRAPDSRRDRADQASIK
jgi:hypothetical protein